MKTLRFSITLLIGLFLFTQCGKGPEIGEPTSDFEITNAQYEISIKEPKIDIFGSKERDDLYLILSCDVKNTSGETLIDYQGMKTGRYFDGEGMLTTQLFLNDYNDLGDFKSLMGTVYLFNGTEGICNLINDERPWKDGVTYKAFLVFELGALNNQKDLGEKDFVKYVLGDANYKPSVELKLSGGFKDERDRYFGNPIEPGFSIEDLRQQVQALADSESDFPNFEVIMHSKRVYEFICVSNGLTINGDFGTVGCPGFGYDLAD